jgi:hypothetical protein
METTIRLSNSVKAKLDIRKVHSRESYNDVIERLTEKINMDVGEDNLKETVEILSDPETMMDIAGALERFNKGASGVSWEDLKKDQKLNV